MAARPRWSPTARWPTPCPTAAFGLHLWNTLPMGRVVAQAGPLMAAADILRIIVRGRGGHGGQPHETVDAIAVTGQVLSALQTIVSRNVDPQDTAVLTHRHGAWRHGVQHHRGDGRDCTAPSAPSRRPCVRPC